MHSPQSHLNQTSLRRDQRADFSAAIRRGAASFLFLLIVICIPMMAHMGLTLSRELGDVQAQAEAIRGW